MYSVYVLYSKEENILYVGLTTNIKRRLNEHKNKKVYSTARYKEPVLIYFENFISESDAIRREGYLKTTQGKKGLRLILRDSLNNYCPVV